VHNALQTHDDQWLDLLDLTHGVCVCLCFFAKGIGFCYTERAIYIDPCLHPNQVYLEPCFIWIDPFPPNTYGLEGIIDLIFTSISPNTYGLEEINIYPNKV
jgi:hypothetical protein